MPKNASKRRHQSPEIYHSKRKPSFINKVLQKAANHASYNAYCTRHPVAEFHHLEIPSRNISLPSCNIALESIDCHCLPDRKPFDHQVDEEYNNLQLRVRTIRHPGHQNRSSINFKAVHRQKLIQSWLSDLRGNPRSSHCTKRLRQFCCKGIPPLLRSQVWLVLMGNPLGITCELFTDCLRQVRQSESHHLNGGHVPEGRQKRDGCYVCSLIFANINPIPHLREVCLAYAENPSVTVSDSGGYSPVGRISMQDRSISLQTVRLDILRTFPELELFQPAQPYHRALHDLLAAYLAYRPGTGYVQGMSFLAGILLLVTSQLLDAFLLLTTILDSPCHRAFYSPKADEEFVVYFQAFDRILASRLPTLHAHLRQVGLEPNMYLFDWLFTLFSRVFPLRITLRMWDLFFVKGEIALFRAALAILHHYETRLLHFSFDQLVVFLTNPLAQDWTEEQLMTEMQAVGIKAKVMQTQLKEVRANLVSPPLSPVPLSSTSTVVVLNLPDPHFGWNPTSFRPAVTEVPLPGPVDHAVTSLFSPNNSSSSSLIGSPDTEVAVAAVAEDDQSHVNGLHPSSPCLSSAKLNLPPPGHRHASRLATLLGAGRLHRQIGRNRLTRWASDWSLNHSWSRALLPSSLSAVSLYRLQQNRQSDTPGSNGPACVRPPVCLPSREDCLIPMRAQVERVP